MHVEEHHLKGLSAEQRTLLQEMGEVDAVRMEGALTWFRADSAPPYTPGANEGTHAKVDLERAEEAYYSGDSRACRVWLNRAKKRLDDSEFFPNDEFNPLAHGPGGGGSPFGQSGHCADDPTEHCADSSAHSTLCPDTSYSNNFYPDFLNPIEEETESTDLLEHTDAVQNVRIEREEVRRRKRAGARMKRVLAARLLSPFVPMTAPHLARVLGVDSRHARRILVRLVEDGNARMEGATRYRVYFGTGKRVGVDA